MNRSTSQALFARAQSSMPGGVNSPVRAFRGVGGEPVFFSKGEGAWLTPMRGIQMKILSLDRGRDSATLLMKVAPGTTYPAHHHKGPEECYVISGQVTIHGQVLTAGDFHHAEPGSDHEEMISIPGCEVLLVVTASDYGL